VNARSRLAAGLVRLHRVLPRAAGYMQTAMFINTRERGYFPDDVCPLGARRVVLSGVPRVAAAYVWGGGEPTVLALHGWGADSTAMSPVVQAALSHGETVTCFDAPGHGISPGSAATVTEYARATHVVLQRFPSVHTVVAHSLSAIAALWADARADADCTRTIILLAPACSLAGVLERWALQRDLPAGVTAGIYRELERRDGVAVSQWDIRAIGLREGVGIRVLHDRDDTVVPIGDSQAICAALGLTVEEVAPGTGHHGILDSDEMRAALTACLRAARQASGPRVGVELKAPDEPEHEQQKTRRRQQARDLAAAAGPDPRVHL